MTPRSIGLVTCESLPDLTIDDRCLIPELALEGVHSAPVVWSDQRVCWTRFDRLVLRSCWDYHERHEEFLKWLQMLEDLDVDVVNPPAVVRWNLHKDYLAAFLANGVPVADSVGVPRGSRMTLARILESKGWRKAVVKPAISASAAGTWCVDVEQGVDNARFGGMSERMDLLVQEFVADVVDRGEWSLVFLGGAFSHAVVKRAAQGEFRVQSEFGGTVLGRVPDGALVRWAQTVAQQIPCCWSYARVDAVETRDGFMLMEVECIEPELFLRHEPAAAKRAALAFIAPRGIRHT